MLYLDSSALVKRYLREKGSDALRERFATAERIFTSALSYAEIQAVLGRKYEARELRKKDFVELREMFIRDWIFSLNVLAVDTKTMAALPSLVEHHPLKANDAVHLAAALWLRDTCRLVPEFAAGDTKLEFGVCDRQLERIARQCGLVVFNPEKSE